MQSIKAIYESGKIKLLEPIPLKGVSNVIITFLDDDYPLEQAQDSEQYLKSLRKYERYKAKGKIIIVSDGLETSYMLYDYSVGGLSFISDQVFEPGKEITAAIKYKITDELLTMNFEIIVRRSIPDAVDYKIGCQFKDDIDEELWHTIMN